MKHSRSSLNVIAIFLLLISITSCSQEPDREQTVGRTHKMFYDDARPSWADPEGRPLAITIWYPSTQKAEEKDWNIAIFKAGHNALNADIAVTPKKFPLVVLSHGTGGAAFQLSWMAEELVQKGFIVIALNHHGNTGAEESLLLEGFTLWWERAIDISSAIDHILAEPVFGAKIDESKIGVLGFSLGGYTALSVAGGITDRQQWREFCLENQASPSCQLPPEAGVSLANLGDKIADNLVMQKSIERSGELFKDKRVQAAYSIAPVLGSAFSVDSLNEISIPVRIVVGSEDDQAVPKDNAELVAASVPNASLLKLPSVGHYTFLAPCSFRGSLFAKSLCSDADGIDRTDIHSKIGIDAAAFFSKALSIETVANGQ